jgi:hypothetical protein
MTHDIGPALIATFGPDGIFGNEDDGDLKLGVGSYWALESFRGRDDTLNTVAFGLSTGQGPAEMIERATTGSRTVRIDVERTKPGIRPEGVTWLGTDRDGFTTRGPWDAAAAAHGRPRGRHRPGGRADVAGQRGGGDGTSRVAVPAGNQPTRSGPGIGDLGIHVAPTASINELPG